MRTLAGHVIAVLLWSSSISALAMPEVETLEAHPASTALALSQPLRLRLHYRSDMPLRFQLRPAELDACHRSAMMNTAPPYPAGEGDAYVGVAFREACPSPALQVDVYDERWQPVMQVPLRQDYEWKRDTVAADEPLPEWATQLSQAQQQATREQLQAFSDDHDRGAMDVVIPLMGWSVLAYLVLQPLLLWRWRGGWRKVAMLPLVIALPVLLYTLFALVAGSNLWPLVMLFTFPLLCLYLLAVLLVRTLQRR